MARVATGPARRRPEGARSARRRSASGSWPMRTRHRCRSRLHPRRRRADRRQFHLCPLGLVVGRSHADDLTPPARGDGQRTGDVVAVADVGQPEAAIARRSRRVSMSARAWQGWWSRVRALTTGTSAAGSKLGHPLVRAGADHDRVDVAREDPRGVADRLAARELHFVAAQHDRRSAQLGDADLEGDPRPGRRLLEDEGDAVPGEDLGTEALALAGLERGGPVEQLAQLEGAQLFSCEEVSLLQQRILRRWNSPP